MPKKNKNKANTEDNLVENLTDDFSKLAGTLFFSSVRHDSRVLKSHVKFHKENLHLEKITPLNRRFSREVQYQKSDGGGVLCTRTPCTSQPTPLYRGVFVNVKFGGKLTN